MKRILLLSLLILSGIQLYAQSHYNAEVSLNIGKAPLKVENHKIYFGTFLEFLNQFINGTDGMWAQEIYDRGFDAIEPPFLEYWKKIGSEESVTLKDGGYNERGVKYLNLKTENAEAFSGISQKMYADIDKDNLFYVYARNNGDETAKLKVVLYSKDGKTEYTNIIIEIPAETKEWTKFSVTIPKTIHSHAELLHIGLVGKGNVDLDECSLMPADNVKGIRRDLYKIFKEWRPGIMRYPGGMFADVYENKIENCIGEIDKRTSPIVLRKGQFQRMDFGADEFLQLCEDFDSEKHIVVNMENATVQDAVDYMEYCNGDETTTMGAIRAKNGRKEPYKVKYCEIGNEQWKDSTWMVNRYNRIQPALVKVDNTMRFLIDGNIWAGESWLIACMNNTRGRCDNYNYHYWHNAIPKKNIKYDDDERYKAVVGVSDVINSDIYTVHTWLDKLQLGHIKQGISEHNLSYNIITGAWLDSNRYNASLEAGLYQAGFLLNLLSNADKFEFYEKTYPMNEIRFDRDKNGKRVIYPTVIQNSLTFIRNNSGDKVYNLNVMTPKYNSYEIENLYTVYNVPYLFAHYSADSLNRYLYLLNRSPKQSANVELDFEITKYFDSYEVYELASEHYLDYNSADEPDKVNYRRIDDTIQDNKIKVKPHSLKVIVAKKTNSVAQNDNPVKIYVDKPFITIDGTADRTFKCGIYNTMGERVFSYNGDNLKLEPQGLPYGMYVLQLSVENRVYHFKFVW